MNCKQGDLAVVVRVREPRFQDAIGKIVKCVSFAFEDYGRSYWFVGEKIVGRFDCVADDCLKPLRDNGGEDETLGWKGVPKPVKEAA